MIQHTRTLITSLLLLTSSAAISNPLTVATIEEPPFIFVNKQGELSGPYFDMLNEIVTRMGYDPTWTLLGYDTVLSSMAINRYDLALALIPINASSCKMFSLTDPIVDYEMVAFSRSEDPNNYTVKELIEGKVRAVTMANGQNARGIKPVLKDDKNLFLTDDSIDVLNWVLAKKADIGLTGSLTASSYMQRGVRVKIVKDFYDPSVFHFDNVQASAIVRSDKPQLLDEFNVVLDEYKQTAKWTTSMNAIGFSQTSILNMSTVKTKNKCLD